MNTLSNNINLSLLADRASIIEDNIDKYIVDDSGKLRSAINRDTMKPFEHGDFDDSNHIIVTDYEDMDYTDFVTYENVGMVSGAFLAAMCWKYKATGDVSALAKARRTYHGIKSLYERSQEIAPGFYCKCWGDNVTDELSSDQYIYSMTGLDLFSEFANDAEKSEIAKIVCGMASFWKDRDYKYNYYGSPIQWKRSRFTGFMALAYKHTGNQEFLDELNQLLSLDEVKETVPFEADFQFTLKQLSNSPLNDYEKDLSPETRLTVLNSEKSQSGFLSIEPVMKLRLCDSEFYLNMAARMLDYGKRGVAPDCAGLRFVYVNLKTKEIKELDTVISLGNVENPPRGWRFCCYVAPVRYGTMATCMFARAAVGIHEYLPELGGLEIAMNILMNVPEDRMTWYEDKTNTLPEDLKWTTKLYNGDAISHWLWTYWEAMAKFK